MKRFAVSVPPPSDERFAMALERVTDAVMDAAMRERIRCALENGVHVFDTEAVLTPDDAEQPRVITVTARVIDAST